MIDINALVRDSVRASAAWAGSALDVRAGWLAAIADAMDAHAEELVSIADRETHLGSPRLNGELARTTAQLRKFSLVVQEGAYLEVTIDHEDPADVPPRPDLRRMLVPLGPVAVWAASNFPFAFSVLGGDTASALAAGNAVIVKAHPGHRELSVRTAELAVEALARAGAPADSIRLIHSREEGVALIQHPGIAAGAFTGSIPGGRALFDQAAARPEPIPFYGELGSVNPVVITERAALERGEELAAGLAGSFTMGMGQFCTKPGIVFIPAGNDFPEWVARSAGAPDALMLNDRIRAAYVAGAEELAGNAGVTVVAGAAPAEGENPGPMVVRTSAAALISDQRLTEEVFGPLTLLVEYSSQEELGEAIAAVPGSLTGTIHAAEGEQTAQLVSALAPRVGRLLFEGWPTGVAVSWAQHHGGPYPATTSLFTSVGATAIRRFLRPIAYQSAPQAILPPALLDANPFQIPQRVDGELRLPAQRG
ncbi:NADP-dependent aldehyde dehydrogenase [Paramicrobacterium humi]|uniref:NADP-dependent aldehyde dehydrogenase n=1 Tax=Paramicrobacterium humi TaxID=640635 RepID=A0A1H4KB08_9MICO|nr:aldehyde dehydrogenase (NADP(+)) [Microbacterium humi]SEB55315.1 NADP-dependent aldehyde dehydrogenase [Microbacterium humi]